MINSTAGVRSTQLPRDGWSIGIGPSLGVQASSIGLGDWLNLDCLLPWDSEGHRRILDPFFAGVLKDPKGMNPVNSWSILSASSLWWMWWSLWSYSGGRYCPQGYWRPPTAAVPDVIHQNGAESCSRAVLPTSSRASNADASGSKGTARGWIGPYTREKKVRTAAYTVKPPPLHTHTHTLAPLPATSLSESPTNPWRPANNVTPSHFLYVFLLFFFPFLFITRTLYVLCYFRCLANVISPNKHHYEGRSASLLS